eukprot:945272-Amphidinium_carterae.1
MHFQWYRKGSRSSNREREREQWSDGTLAVHAPQSTDHVLRTKRALRNQHADKWKVGVHIRELDQQLHWRIFATFTRKASSPTSDWAKYQVATIWGACGSEPVDVSGAKTYKYHVSPHGDSSIPTANLWSGSPRNRRGGQRRPLQISKDRFSSQENNPLPSFSLS